VLHEHGYAFRQGISPVGAAIGTATHAAVAHTMQEKANTGHCANETETEQCGLQSLSEEIGKGVRFDAISDNLNTAQKQVIRQYRSYRLHLADTINPISIERRITVETQRGNLLSGAMDLADAGIRDLKTGVQQRVNIAQYGVYSLLRRSEGDTPTYLCEDYIRRVAISKEQPAPVVVTYNREFAERVAASIINDIEMKFERYMETQDPLTFLANPASQLCSDRYCPCFQSPFCPESYGKGAVAGVLDL
jgi:hypothetical protein